MAEKQPGMISNILQVSEKHLNGVWNLTCVCMPVYVCVCVCVLYIPRISVCALHSKDQIIMWGPINISIKFYTMFKYCSGYTL